jgi:long-chain acyl-CoA synthetase
MGSASFKSVVEMFHHRVRSTPDTDAFYHRVSGQWKTMLWREAGERARAIACGLHALGLAPEERVSLFSATRVEWILADMGILCAAGATTTIYPSSTPEEARFILKDSDSRFVIADSEKQVTKLKEIRGEVPGLRNVIVMDGKGSEDGWVLTLAELERRGKEWEAQHPGEYDRLADAVGSDSQIGRAHV